jgi:hypothetical protein
MRTPQIVLSVGSTFLQINVTDYNCTYLQYLMLHVLNLAPHSAIPLVRIERQEVDDMVRPAQEWDENMRGVAVSDDGYGRILAHN